MGGRRLRGAVALLPWAALLLACGQAGAVSGPERSTAVPPPVVSPAPSAAVPSGSAPPGPAVRSSGPPTRARPLTGKVITLDPGHNGGNGAHPEIIDRLVPAGPARKPCNTTGTATDAGYPEHAYTFDVSIRLMRLLRARGATVVLTRPDDHGVGPCVDQRAAIATRAHSDAALSIHADGVPAGDHGFHVIMPALLPGYTGPIVGPSRRLGEAVRDAFRTGAGVPYSNYVGRQGLDVRDDLGGLNMATVPSVFIECGNMHNPADAARLSNAAWRQRAARALAAGLTAYLTR